MSTMFYSMYQKTCIQSLVKNGTVVSEKHRFCQIYRVTDEAFIAETAVWPNFFLMNVFFALKDLNFLLLFNLYM